MDEEYGVERLTGWLGEHVSIGAPIKVGGLVLDS